MYPFGTGESSQVRTMGTGCDREDPRGKGRLRTTGKLRDTAVGRPVCLRMWCNRAGLGGCLSDRVLSPTRSCHAEETSHAQRLFRQRSVHLLQTVAQTHASSEGLAFSSDLLLGTGLMPSQRALRATARSAPWLRLKCRRTSPAKGQSGCTTMRPQRRRSCPAVVSFHHTESL